MVLNYYPYIFNQAVICGVREFEASPHLWRSRVRGEQSFAAIEVERVSQLLTHQNCRLNARKARVQAL